MMAGLISDLKHAVRLYLKTPWQSVLAMVMLAAAMALVAAMASLWSDLHLGGTPGLADDRGLITIGQRGAGGCGGLFSASTLRELAETSQTLQTVSGAWRINHIDLEDFAGEPLEGNVEPVMVGYFETLSPIIVRGRGLDAGDFSGGGDRVMVLSHDLWQSRFDGDPAIVGQEIDIEGKRWRVVGVAHEAFQGIFSTSPAFWLPYRRYLIDVQQYGMPEETIDQVPRWQGIGRKVPDTGTKAVESEIRRFFEGLPPPELGIPPDPERVLVFNGIVEHPEAREQAQRQTTMLLAAAVLIAAVAAVNIGIFLLARAPARRRELALRQAVGAGRRRLSGQLLIEAAVLVTMATLAGVVLSIWLAAGIREMRFLENAGFAGDLLNWPAFGFSALLATVFTLLVALVPIALLRGRTLSQESRQISARPGLFQHAAGLIQLSLAGLVGAAAVGFLLHLWIMDQRDPGFNPENVQVAAVSFRERPTGGFRMPPPEDIHSYREDVRDTLGALPGVEQVSFASPLPGQQMTAFGSFEIDGERIEPRMVSIAPEYMDLLDMPLLRGVEPEHDLTQGVVINRDFAMRAWGEIDVADRFLIDTDGDEPDERWRVIGVVENVRYDHPDKPSEPMMFSASSGMFAGIMASVIVRGNADPALVEERVNEVLERHHDLLHVTRVDPLTGLMAELTAADRGRALITGLFGVVILLMAGFGFFAMQRFLVDAGMRETAIRMALGAGPRLTRRQVFIQGLKLGLPGLAIGSLLAVITAAWLTDDLITADISAAGVASAVAIVLLALMLIASIQPAIRAARLKPGNLLKEE